MGDTYPDPHPDPPLEGEGGRNGDCAFIWPHIGVAVAGVHSSVLK
jgi:hypothetical protein